MGFGYQRGAPPQIGERDRFDNERAFLNVPQESQKCGVSQSNPQQLVDLAQGWRGQDENVAFRFDCRAKAGVRGVAPIVKAVDGAGIGYDRHRLRVKQVYRCR